MCESAGAPMKEGADSLFTCLIAQTLEEAFYKRIRACMRGPT